MQNLLLKKLQIKSGHVVKVDAAPENAAAIFGEIPADISFTYNSSAKFDALICFSINKADLYSQIERNLKEIKPGAVIWIFYPKKSSKIKSDLDLMNSWKELETYGLAPCASAAIDNIWTGLRLKLASEVKASGVGNAEIKQNEFAEFIDVDKKIVKLPADLEAILINHPSALQHFNALSYTNKKEYVLWILTAKQEKTRTSRLEKTLEMLLNGKKNPSAKG
ncbi:YdeI/OmpD-associated family protein [Pedobacter punctiformis]|uniref:YdeI/OmpD-associated family protein n=1 Tax=Pedobacter punctiformis TaxID=3004097 RepID=A0ABT4L7B7_9SPHI|nr:YdeI/OmpD-associated family protein [Pedobacter sp. HCMS5-2]MCZ4243731.1 YdeI/OmpD-associated family protein [Pedobacter sp. HCMS5-2]